MKKVAYIGVVKNINENEFIKGLDKVTDICNDKNYETEIQYMPLVNHFNSQICFTALVIGRIDIVENKEKEG